MVPVQTRLFSLERLEPAERLVEESQRQSVAVPMPVLMLCSRLRQPASQSAVVP